MRATAFCIISVSVLCLFSSSRALAQAQAEPPAKKVQIEEITVTAERREESAQDVGQAIEAFSTEELDRRGIDNIYELSAAVPSLQVTGGLPQPTLRGISSDVVSFGVDAPFAAHINGQYVPNLSVALLPFLDVERVEVLYGPQGTLFGHATTGGTLNFITGLPDGELGFELKGDYATYDKASVETVLNVPLVPEKVLSRIAYRRGWASRVMDVKGGHNGGLSNNALTAGDAARLTLSFLPQDNVRVDLIGGWAFDDSTGGGVKRLEPYPAFPAGRPTLTNNFNASPNYTGATPNPRDPNDISWNLRQSQDYTVGLAQALVSVDMGWATFKSNSSYYSFDYYVDRDQDASDLEIQRLHLESIDVQYGQEFLLQSSTGNFIDWLVGANYYNHNAPDADVPFWDKQASADAANFFILTTQGLFAPPFSVLTPLNGDPLLRVKSDAKTRVWGIFGHTWINFTDQFRFVGGLRYSNTERWFEDNSTFNVFVPPPGPPAPGVAIILPLVGAGKQNKEWDFITWRGGFEFEPTDDSLLYVSYSRGEQAGGYNYLAVEPIIEPVNPDGSGPLTLRTIPPFDSETIYALEGGAKTQFLDDRLQVNLAAYHYNYKNKFITRTIASGITETINAPNALIYGMELSSIYLPTDELRLNGTLGLVHSEYKEDFFAVDSALSSLCTINAPCDPDDPYTDLQAPLPEKNIKGNKLNRSPAVTVNLGAEYAFALGDWGTLTPRVEHSWRDKIYFTQFNDEATSQGSYHLTSARIRIEPADGSYWLEVYGTNLQNNDKIRTQVEGFNANPQWWLEEPRIFGVRVGYKYF